MNKEFPPKRNRFYSALAVVIGFGILWYVMKPPKVPSVPARPSVPLPQDKSEERKQTRDRAKDAAALNLFLNPDFLSIEESVVAHHVIIIDDHRKVAVEEKVSTPNNVSATDIKNGKTVTITWDAFANPPSFVRIFRSEDPTQEGIQVGEVSGSSLGFHDTDIGVGKKYYYTVFGALQDGSKSALQGPFAVGPIEDSVLPDAPSSIKIVSMADGVHISWKDPSNDDLASIIIYRSKQRGDVGEIVAQIEPKVEEFTDSEVFAGNTYYYFLKSKDINGNESGNDLIDAKLGNPNIFTPAF